MTTQEIANRYKELEKLSNSTEIHNQLYSADAVSIEPEHATQIGMAPLTKGMEAIRAKSVAFNENISEVHGGYSGEPVVGGNFFSLAMGMEVTWKNGHRMKMDEIAVFGVKDDKIISEQFFY